jgi:glycosyltransferase involved in cell wall biosynthesis
MPVIDAGNIPPGPILKGGTTRRNHQSSRKTTRRKIPTPAQGIKWPSGSIVYICGVTREPFGPSDTALGGSEQAVVKLSESWAAAGRPVVVYGTVKESTKAGVEYRSIHKLNLADTFDCAIFWRSNGVRLLPLVNARVKLVDLHDAWDPKNYVAVSQLLELTDKFMVKSEYHRSLYDYIPDSKIATIMNGVQVDLFESVINGISEADRKPHRCIYASTYERGLEPILRYTWPKIKAAIPDATFDIYYGMNRLAKTPLGYKLNALFKQPGVKEHGRVSLEQIAQEKAKSAIHLYVSNSPTEIDCISVRESLLCGSVPILGNDYVFSERDGVHVIGSTNKASTYKSAAKTVIRLLNDPAALEKKRNELKKSKTIVPWETVANEWLKVINAFK